MSSRHTQLLRAVMSSMVLASQQASVWGKGFPIGIWRMDESSALHFLVNLKKYEEALT